MRPGKTSLTPLLSHRHPTAFRMMGLVEQASTRSERHASGDRALSRRGDGWLFLVAATVVILDQLTKWGVRTWVDRGDAWPGDWLVKIIHVTNSGAAFGILQDSGPLLLITGVLGSLAILVYLLNPGFADPWVRLGLALMLGGAVGNLIDRLVAGEVVDFIKVPNWPAFNVADSAITIGVLVLLWATLFGRTATAKQPS